MMDNSPGAELDNVIKLFTGPNSAALHERHVAAVNRLCKNNVNGFAIRDLPKVQQVLELTLQLLLEGLDLFLLPACEIVRTLTKPFIKLSSTDEFKMLNFIANILVPVAKTLSDAHSLELKMCAVEMLTAFATAHGQKPVVLDANFTKTELNEMGPMRQYYTNQSLIARSGTVNWIVLSLSHASAAGDGPMIYALVGILLNFSYLPDNCVQMVESGLVTVLPSLLF
jgi:hypothetical protein